MSRRKIQSRGLSGSHLFTNPREAAAFVRGLMEKGAIVEGTRSAMSSIGVQPHHFIDKKMPDAESRFLAQQTDEVGGPVEATYAPTSSSNPNNPRTASAGYDPLTHRLYVEWGDGGTPYYYYDVTPQEWSGFQDAPSPGKYINVVLNGKNYGPIQ